MEEQEYLLDPVFAEKYKDVESPEFSFTSSTLFDALAQVEDAYMQYRALSLDMCETVALTTRIITLRLTSWAVTSKHRLCHLWCIKTTT